MKPVNRILIFLSGIFLGIGISMANDSTARVSAGGLVLLKNQHIRMVQEVLEISPKLVRVKYQFINESPSNISTTVAFPMPAYGWHPGMSASDSNNRPLRDFKLLIEGKQVPTQLHSKAVVGERDITQSLRDFGLTNSQIFDKSNECDVVNDPIQCGLSKLQQKQIMNLLGKNKSSVEWRVVETVFWEQVFPTGKTIAVDHEYSPFVGHSYQLADVASDELPTAAWLNPPATANEACLDGGTRQAISRKVRALSKAGAKEVWISLNDVEYILGTGRNWKGPIRDFKLRIVKTSPDQFVSLCFPGKPQRISPTVIDFTHSDFTPQDRLIVHFYTLTAVS